MTQASKEKEAPEAKTEAKTETRKSSRPWPKKPEDLLKERYKSFVEGDVDFVLETHHPETRDQVEESAVENWSKNSKWHGLEIHSVESPSKDKDKTFIEFTARYERNYETTDHKEIAEFRKVDGQWFYYDSEFPTPEPVRREGEKVGRNDPCPCGSGKKYKKCHAAA